MDGYKLTGEEPGKDALVLTSDDSQFMRIEMMSSKASMDDAAQSVKQTATAVNKNAAEKKILKRMESSKILFGMKPHLAIIR
ncbi:hypothetical protein AAAC51_13195 [Priestia megaterium]